MAKNICKKEGSLMNYETPFSQHNYYLNVMVLEKQIQIHPLKSSQILYSSCQTIDLVDPDAQQSLQSDNTKADTALDCHIKGRY